MKKHKIPVTLALEVPQQRLLIGYLWLRSLTPSDRLYKKGLKNNKNKVYYWAKKLNSAGLIEEFADYYRIKGVHTVWGILGVSKVKKHHGGKGWRYSNLDIKNDNFIKDGLTTYHQFLIKRKKRQIVNVVAAKDNTSEKITKTKTCRLSCTSVSALLGYRSDMTGLKYRRKYFKVVKPACTKLIKTVKDTTSSGAIYSFKYPCYSVSLSD